MPRGRTPNEEQRAERRAAILQAAIPFFVRHGFHEARVSDIARAAGVSHGTVFLYFPTKEDLFRAASLEPLKAAEAHFRMILALPGSPVERITRMVREQVAAFASMVDYLRLQFLISAQREVFPEIFAEGQSYTRRYADLLSELIREGQAAGQLAPGNPEAIALSYFGFLNGITAIVTESADAPIWSEFVACGLRLFNPL